MTSALLELADRCEKAAGPDCELDAEIGRYTVADFLGYVPDRPQHGCQPYTASLDAAMTLMPEGWWVQHVGWCLNGWRARVERNAARHTESESAGFGPGAPPIKTAALALTAACLRAHAAKEDNLSLSPKEDNLSLSPKEGSQDGK